MRLLRERGGRASGPRRVILEALITAGEHRTAEELAADIHDRHPEIHQATVYRSLERFEDLGVAYHTHLGHGPATWHLNQPAPHQHLTCESCSAVVEADAELLDQLQADVLARYGFAIDTHHFALTGTCAACRSARPTAGTAGTGETGGGSTG